MDKVSLIRQLQQLPDDVKIMVRDGNDKAGSPILTILEGDDNKLLLYFTTFSQLLRDRNIKEDTSLGLLEDYPDHLREVCHHGRSAMKMCDECENEAALHAIELITQEIKKINDVQSLYIDTTDEEYPTFARFYVVVYELTKELELELEKIDEEFKDHFECGLILSRINLDSLKENANLLSILEKCKKLL